MPLVVRLCALVGLLFTAGLPIARAQPGADTEAEPEQILVFGGTGRLGSDVVKALIDANFVVTVFARPTSNRRRLEGLSVSYVIGDVLVAEDVDAALAAKPFAVVIDALGRGKAPVEFYTHSAQNIARAAAAGSVRQLILHGSVGARASAATLGASMSTGMQRIMAAKSAGEEAVVQSGVPYTIIRNWRVLAYGTPASGNAILTTDQSATGSVTRAGLARLTVQCVLVNACLNQVYHAVEP